MNYEAILNKSEDTFSILKYGFEHKVDELEKFMWTDKKAKQKNHVIYSLHDKQKIEDILKIDVQELIKTSIPYSFAIQTSFTLESPYFSRDDDEFYIINNPCLKEKVFKVPMVRGSGWKGALLNGAREIINESADNAKKVANLKSYFRVFGVGDESFRDIVDKVDDNAFKLFFMLSGMAINVNDDVKNIFQKYQKDKAGKGRAIFYPTYFDKYSIELINPHNRQTKAGTNPIHYEVVPKGTKGELQIVYIPFDGVMKSNATIEQEAKEDLEFLKLCIDKALTNGIGAKTKLGWGKGKSSEIKEFWSER